MNELVKDGVSPERFECAVRSVVEYLQDEWDDAVATHAPEDVKTGEYFMPPAMHIASDLFVLRYWLDQQRSSNGPVTKLLNRVKIILRRRRHSCYRWGVAVSRRAFGRAGRQ